MSNPTETIGNLEVHTKRCNETPKLVKFGRAGHVVYFASVESEYGSSKSTQSGYDDPENFFMPSKWWAHNHLEQRDAAQFEGVPWLNVRSAVETPEGYAMAINGPMVDVDLQDDEIDRCPQPTELLAVGLTMSSNTFGTLLGLQAVSRAKRESVGPLDSVSVSEYLRRWKAVGAKCGVIRNGQFIES